MGITGSEVSAVNQQRHMEELSSSPVGDALESGGSLVGATVALGTSLVVAGGPVGLAVAGSVVAGMGIVGWFRKLGTSKVNENLETLGQATEDALNRVERVLLEQGTGIEEIRERLNSQEFKDGMASASLQALRTTQEVKLKRMARLLANGLLHNDLEPEGLDYMMRAAVELKDADIVLLGKICTSQRSLLQQQRGRDSTYWFGALQTVWDEFVRSGALNAPNHLVYRSSFLRLESRGLIQKFREISTAGVGLEPYALLEEGIRFYEHLQEIAARQ